MNPPCAGCCDADPGCARGPITVEVCGATSDAQFWVVRPRVGIGWASGLETLLSGRLSDVSNESGAFTVVRADSHEAAASMFEKHPHFTIFPGDAIEVMPVLTIPAG
jgi:hypothetical protein